MFVDTFEFLLKRNPAITASSEWIQSFDYRSEYGVCLNPICMKLKHNEEY